MGADNAVHVQDPAVAANDPWQIASIIAAYAKDKGFDLIFTGMQSQDRGSAQVGVAVAEQLGYSCTTTIVGFQYENGTVTAKRELEGGVKGVVKLKTPALVTCQLGLNVPRYPTLPNIMKAKRKEITIIAVADLLSEAALATTASFHPPAKKGGGIVLEGAVERVGGQGGGSAQGKDCVIAIVAFRSAKVRQMSPFAPRKYVSVAFRSAKVALLSRSERRLCRQLIRLEDLNCEKFGSHHESTLDWRIPRRKAARLDL